MLSKLGEAKEKSGRPVAWAFVEEKKRRKKKVLVGKESKKH